MSEKKSSTQTQVIAEIAAFVALSAALSYVKVFSLPQGGSVTAGSMVPVIWLSLRRGAKIGVFSCVLYGLVQLAVEPFVYHPIQILLDYPVAFGALGLAGFFQKRSVSTRGTTFTADRLTAVFVCLVSIFLFVYELVRFRLGEATFFAWIFAFSFVFLLWLEERVRTKKIEVRRRNVASALTGAAVGIFGRFCAHFLSGFVFFGSYAPEGMNPVFYSAFYNGSYIIPELLVSAYLIYLLAKSGLTEIYR